MTPWVMRLLIANLVVFGLQILQPGITQEMAFVPRLALVRPWTILTYMFVHGGFGHIFFNMLGLFFFGSRVEQRLGATRFAQLYVVSGICGALLSMALSPNAAIIGASAGVFGVSLAFAYFWPREKIYVYGVLPVEAWLLVVIYGGLELSSGLGGARTGVAHFAHLGGYAGALIFLLLMQRFSPSRQFRRKVNAVAPVTERALKLNWKNVNLDGVHELSREEVNRILDKINAEGIGSLTAQEKLFLSNFVPPDDRKSWTQ